MTTDETIVKMCKDYVSSNLTMKDIAKKYQCSSSHVSKMLHKAILFRYY